MTDNRLIPVLDRGYVRLVDTMGDDLSVVNAARVSFDKESKLSAENELSPNDSRLLKFLWNEKHTAPFRHAALTFEIYAPLMVARQHWKHAVASTYVDDQNGWNESSRRYITEEPVFHIPYSADWRSAPDNAKQGSGAPLEIWKGDILSQHLFDHINRSVLLYEQAMDAGVCAEQARLFLPAYSMYVRYRWTVSLHGLMAYLQLRLDDHAQEEIQEYARAVHWLASAQFPNSMNLLEI